MSEWKNISLEYKELIKQLYSVTLPLRIGNPVNRYTLDLIKKQMDILDAKIDNYTNQLTASKEANGVK